MIEPMSTPVSAVNLRLQNALNETNSDLEAIYNSAINVLKAENIPDLVRMSAFGIRELLNKLPDYINAPFKKNTEKLGILTARLKAKWDGQKIKSYIEITWTEIHQEQIKNFLYECRDFFQLNDEIHKSRKEKAIATSKTLNTKHSEENLPEHIEEIIANQWNEFLDYFNGVAHSEYGETNEAVYMIQLCKLEKFLIGLLEPDVFDSMGELDEIIRQGENEK